MRSRAILERNSATQQLHPHVAPDAGRSQEAVPAREQPLLDASVRLAHLPVLDERASLVELPQVSGAAGHEGDQAVPVKFLCCLRPVYSRTVRFVLSS